MKLLKQLIRPALATFLTLAAAFVSTAAQTGAPPPREEKLLNGLRLLVWNQPNAEKVSLRLRVHSGSAFDPQGKEGAMRLLAEVLFPDESIKDFFRDDLGGELEILSNYDYIQINASGNSDRFLTVMETLAAALTNPSINKESTEKVRARLLAEVRELEKNPVYVADRSVARKLFGTFPYGRPESGSTESLARVDFADLILAKERFLTSDNATLAIVGNVRPDFALRATKRLFGGWIKSDRKVPPTFAQPEPPISTMDFVAAAGAETAEIRQAVRGLAKNDKDLAAARIVEKVLQERFEKALATAGGARSYVRGDAHVLPGIVVFGASVPVENAKTALENSHKADYFKSISAEEFARAKTALAADASSPNASLPAAADRWLDVETYRLTPLSEQLKASTAVSLADAERVLDRLYRNAKFASVIVGDPEKLKQVIEPVKPTGN